MKRELHFIIPCLVVLLCVVPALGQVVIDSSDIPTEIGYRYTQTCSDDLVPVNPGSAGANQTWDLRGISATSTGEAEVIDRSETPNPSWIPDANVILRTTEELDQYIFTYNQLTNEYGKTLGMVWSTPDSNFVVEWESDPPQFIFPIEYESNWMTRVYWEQSIGGVTMTVTDTTWITVDGWGTVILDQVGSVNALRLKERQHTVTTVTGWDTHQWCWRYSWMAPGYPDLASMQSEEGAGPDFTTGYFCRAGGFSTAEEPVEILPVAFELGSPYPNPFNPETTIPYSVNQLMDIELAIYNALGQKVRTLAHGRTPPGSYSVVWNGTDNAGNRVGTGVYYCRLLSPQGSASAQRLMLVR